MTRILDACCGSRMFWFNRQNPDAIYMDIRRENYILCDNRKLEITPDVLADFRDMPFPDNHFYHVVFDPPHFENLGPQSWMGKKYGRLGKEWQADLKKGFDECLRVLKPNGTLIFKWNETRIPVSKIIEVIGKQPLYGHLSGKASKTHWMAFMKDEVSNV